MTTIINSAIILSLVAILASLGSGLVFLFKDPSSSRRTAKALTVRITLSVVLLLAIVAGILTGSIDPTAAF